MRRLPRIRFSLSAERQRLVYDEIEELSKPTWSYYARVAISTTIATYGLLANSTAVVIGAMLIAPLMGPIFGVALSLSSGDQRLLRRSASSEAVGVLLAFSIAALAGLVPLNLGIGSEVLARTQPTLYDLIVALASGLAGAYATVDEKLSATLPGVAISTALVPPIATAGLCFSAGQMEWAFGAFLLFFANFVAIQVASASIFVAYGLPRARHAQPLDLPHFLRRFAVSLVLLLAVGAFMTRTLVRLIEDRRLSDSVGSVLREQVRRASGAALSSFELSRDGAEVDVVATVLTPQEFRPEQVAQIENVLRERIRPEMNLVLRSLISKDFDRDGAVYLPAVASETNAAIEAQTTLLRDSTSVLSEELAKVPGARLVEVRREGGGGPMRLFALVRAPKAIEPGQVATLQLALAEKLGTPVSLTIRSVLARDADAARFIYDETAPAEPAREADLEHRRKLEEILRAGLVRGPGVSLGEVHEFAVRDRTLVHVELRSPRALSASDVSRVQAELRREVSPRIDLVVRYALGADVSASGLATFPDGELPRIPSAWETDAFRKSLRFARGSARLSPSARAALGEATPALLESGDAPILVTGFSDDGGSAQLNVAIGLARAKAVRDELVRGGVPSARIQVESRGEADPIAPNATSEGRARNRRVELRIAPRP